MRIDFHISQNEMGNFMESCEAVIRNVGRGAKAATEYAAWDIMSESLGQVPVDTGTLASSAFAGVSRRTDTKNYTYGAVLGYGDIRGMAKQANLGPIEWLMTPSNPVNPRSGLPASAYSARVHEDLDMPHPNGGKAKFLEDPIREWASGKFTRTAMTYWKRAIEYSNKRSLLADYYSRREGRRKPTFSKFRPMPTRTSKFVEAGKGVQRGGQSVYKGESR